jgi:hypothetical protein
VLLTAAIDVEFLIAIIALALLVVVILVISAPLRAGWGAAGEEPVEGAEGSKRGGGSMGEGRGEHEAEGGASDRGGVDRDRVGRGGIGPAERRAELEAAREAKYREIRDTELDYRTGKLSQDDFAATDGALRAEAVEILDWLEALEKEEGEDGR